MRLEDPELRSILICAARAELGNHPLTDTFFTSLWAEGSLNGCEAASRPVKHPAGSGHWNLVNSQLP